MVCTAYTAGTGLTSRRSLYCMRRACIEGHMEVYTPITTFVQLFGEQEIVPAGYRCFGQIWQYFLVHFDVHFVIDLLSLG